MPAKFEPSKEQRLTVKLHKIAGTPDELIARVVTNPKTGRSITKKTLYVAFRDELDLGKIEVDKLAVGKLVGAIQRGEAWAICFYMKTQMNWSEKQRQEVTGRDGGPIRTDARLDLNAEACSAHDKLGSALAAGDAGEVAE